jgi:hypothetical protein
MALSLTCSRISLTQALFAIGGAFALSVLAQAPSWAQATSFPDGADAATQNVTLNGTLDGLAGSQVEFEAPFFITIDNGLLQPNQSYTVTIPIENFTDGFDIEVSLEPTFFLPEGIESVAAVSDIVIPENQSGNLEVVVTTDDLTTIPADTPVVFSILVRAERVTP